MNRRLQAAALAIGLAVVVAGASPAAGLTSVSLTPSSQSHPHGQTSSWTGAWYGGPSPYVYRFNRGDGTAQTGSTSSTSMLFSYTFWPCSTTTYHQTLGVTDDDGDHKVSNRTQSTEQGGSPC